jgi:hypothetical protein
MALTLSAAATEAVSRQSVHLVPIVNLKLSVSVTLTFIGTDLLPSTSAAVDYISSVVGMTPIEPSIDPISRKMQSGGTTITLLDDGSLREAHLTYRIKNREIEVLMAPADDLTTTIPAWRGMVDDMVPRGDGTIELRCIDALAYVEMDGRFYGRLRPQHPLEAVELMVTESDVPASFIDTTTLDPDADTAISHFMISTAWMHGETSGADAPPLQLGETDISFGLPTPPGGAGEGALTAGDDPTAINLESIYLNRRDSIEQLARMCDGAMLVSEEGEIYFKRFDPTASTVATWTADDIVSISVQSSGYDLLINEVRCKLGEGSLERLYVRRDTNSQSNFAPAGSSTWVRAHDLSLPFALSRLEWDDEYTAAEATDGTITISKVVGRPITGTRTSPSYVLQPTPLGDPGTPLPQNATSKVSTDRPMYIQSQDEIIKVTGAHTGLIPFFFGGSNFLDVDSFGQLTGTESAWSAGLVQLNGVTRGFAGTARTLHPRTWARRPVHDITALRFVADSLLNRAANGIPILEVETPYSEIAVQVGDLVEINSDLPTLYSFDGIDSTNVIKWEVISKSLDPTGATGTIRWRLAFATVATPPWTLAGADDPVEMASYPGHYWGSGGEFYHNTTQSIPKSVWTPLSFNTAPADYLSGWDSTTDQFTAPQAGFYHIDAGALFDGVSQYTYCQLAVYVNSGGGGFLQARLSPRFYNPAPAAQDIQATLSTDINLLVGDVVEIRAFHSDSVAVTVNGGRESTYLVMRYLG